MSKYKPLMMLFILVAALLVACGPQGAEPGVEEPATTMPDATMPPAAETPETEGAGDAGADAITAAATARLAQELGMTEDEIEFVSAEATEFTDSCLGLGQLNESCLQAMTPGWLIMLSAGGQEYEVHTDLTGEQVRVAVETPEGNSAADSATAAAQEFLVSQLGVALGDVQVVSAEATEFTDSCLGLGQANESCLQAMTPGWLIKVDVNGQAYEVHTDETGQQVRVAGQSE
ncbi:MAG: hypothetical protein KA586_07295 [Candidatus Promineofilum sp.]|nr:hypothetical protein [Promineifilum sp.]